MRSRAQVYLVVVVVVVAVVVVVLRSLLWANLGPNFGELERANKAQLAAVRNPASPQDPSRIGSL